MMMMLLINNRVKSHSFSVDIPSWHAVDHHQHSILVLLSNADEHGANVHSMLTLDLSQIDTTYSVESDGQN
jgi:hypothetical protein